METNRLKLHAFLSTLCPNVYYQPPATVKLKYPCIIYDISDIDDQFANNKCYLTNFKYTLQVISVSPIDQLINSVKMTAKFVDHYSADNLNHHMFTIYY